MCNSLYKTILFIAAILWVNGIVVAQDKGIFGETTYITSYGINEFGRLLFVNDIAETPNGCIILGSTDGLSILSSQETQFITTPNHSGISHVICTYDGKILVSGDVDNGYFTFSNTGKEIYHDLNDNSSLKNENIIQLIPYGSSFCYVGRNSIHILDTNDNITRIKFDRIKSAFSIGNNPFIVSDDCKLHTIDGKITREILNFNKISNRKIEFVKGVDLGNDTTLLITNQMFLKIGISDLTNGNNLTANDFRKIEINDKDLEKCTINDATYDKVINKIAISTSNGILVFNTKGELINRINKTNGLPISEAQRLLFDSKHNLWTSLNSILAKIELSSHTVYYNSNQGLSGDIYYFEKYKGQYYCSTFNDVYTATVDNGNTIFKKVNFAGCQNITCWNICTFEDHLLACTADGLYEIEGLEARKILNTGKIYNLASTPTLPNKIIMTCYEGLIVADYSIEGNRLKFGTPYKVKGLDIPMWSILVDKRGMLWISSIFNGLYYLVPKDKDFERYSLVNIGENVNLKDLRQPRFNVTDKYLYTYGVEFNRAELPDKTDFMANEIKLKKSEVFDNYIKKFESTEICPLNEDGDVFINTKRNYIIASRKSKTFDTINFQTKINMVNNVFMEDSTLFLSTDIGLLKHNIKARSENNPGLYPFHTIINGIYINDSAIYKGFRHFGGQDVYEYQIDDEEFQYIDMDVNSLSIKYSSTCFENIEMITYSYMLEGKSNKWSEFSPDNTHNFGQLSPGDYTFRVRARNNHGIISSEAIYRFSIPRNIFLRWWAILIYSIIFCTVLFILLRRLYYYKKENARLDSINKKQYDEIIRQNERLKLLSLVASKNTNSVMILSNDGKFKWENDSFTNFYGYSPKEYKETFGENYFSIQKKVSPYNESAISTAINEKSRASFETMHIGPNGHQVYVQTHLDPVLEENGELKNWIVTETNITQLKLAEKEGMQQAEKLVEAYSDLKRNQDNLEFQTRQLKIINERLEIGYKQIKRQNITINQSLRYAQGIQNSILPSHEKFQEFIDYSVMYWPKDIVSGDFYMCEKISENSVITIVADCTGHGVPGAFMSIIGYDILSQLILYRKIDEPRMILELLSKQMIEMLDMKRIQNTDGIALSICRFDKHADHVDLTYAGSDSSIYIQRTERNTIERIKGSRRQTGINGEIFNHKPFEQTTIEIDYNDRILMFTDGIIDQCNEQRRRYGTPRFEKLLSDYVATPIEEIGTIIETDVTVFMQDAAQRDDITVLALNIRK